MTQISIFDSKNIDQIRWPDSEEGKLAREFLLPMMQEGVKNYIQNVDTKLYLIQVNDQLIPISVNEKEYDNSYLTSNYFPIRYLQERLHKAPSLLAPLQKPLILGAGCMLKGMKINKAVIVNNWLLTTNIYPKLNARELHDLTQFLISHFTDHALIFRSLNMRKCTELASFLEEQKYRLLYSRHVFIYDPDRKGDFSSKVHYHHRRDRRLIESEGYEVVRPTTLKDEEANHLLSLYKKLYIDRHTAYSPQFTAKYLKTAAANGFLRLLCLRKEGEVHGVIGFHERGGTLITPFCGYDDNKGEANHLYRMLTILAIDEAEKSAALLNDGSGGSAPKKYRGMQAFPEYVALYDRHLPAPRRLFWGLAEKMVQRFALAKINEEDKNPDQRASI